MPQPKPITTNSRSSAILAKLAAIIANSGVLLSPRQRSTAAAILYAMMMREPPNCTYKYVGAPPNTAGSVCSSVSRGLTSSRLMIVTAMPNQHDSLTIIASTRRSRSYAPAPNSCAARIAKPCVKPCSPHKTSQLIQSAAPMDASAWHADTASDDDRIHDGIQLLKHAAQHQRQRKQQNQPYRTTVCHIGNAHHIAPPLRKIIKPKAQKETELHFGFQNDGTAECC